MSKEARKSGDSDERFLTAGLADLFRRVEPILGTLAAVSGLAFLVGRFSADAYFTALGAPWLVEQLSPGATIAYSQRALLLLVFFVLTSYLDLADGIFSPKGLDRLGWTATWIALALSLGSGIALALGSIRWELSLAIAAAPCWATSAATLFNITVYRASRVGHYGARSILALFVVAFIALYSAPRGVAAAQGRRDASPSSSKLPAATVDPGEPCYAVLLATGSALYVARLGEKPLRVRTLDPRAAEVSMRCPADPPLPNEQP